jgi:hypothetical protein
MPSPRLPRVARPPPRPHPPREKPADHVRRAQGISGSCDIEGVRKPQPKDGQPLVAATATGRSSLI